MKLPRSSPNRASCASHCEIDLVGLATRHVLDVEGVHDQGGDAGPFEMGEHAFPINAGALHHHLLDAMFLQPANQLTHVALEAAKFAGLLQHRAVSLRDQDCHRVLHSVHIDPGNPFVNAGELGEKIMRR